MARPLVVRVGDLLREPGSRRTLDHAADLGVLGTSSAETVAGSTIDLDGEVMGMAGGVEITAVLGFEWHGECRRCLEDVTGRIELPVREVAQRDPVDDEVWEIDGDLLDLEPLVRELVLASLPLAPLCKDDCAGPDPERFPASVESDGDDGPAPDPRWAALRDLEFE